MKFIDLLYEVAGDTKTPVTRIGLHIGVGREYVSRMKRNGTDPSTANAARMLEACGWKLVAVPEGAVPEYALEISPTDTSEKDRYEALRRQAEQLRRQADALLKQADGK
jgi:hypothetical protein